MAIRTTTYRVGYAERCHSCGSVRSGRGIGEYRKHDDGNETLINCSDCHREIACECGKVYPISESEKLSPNRINNVAKACTACNGHPGPATEPELLFPHVYKRVFRDVACRYIQRFGGSTFSVQTDADDCEIYLRNREGLTIASVSLLDRYPKPPAPETFADMPY